MVVIFMRIMVMDHGECDFVEFGGCVVVYCCLCRGFSVFVQGV